MEQSVPVNSSLLGKSPPSPGGATPELIEAKKGVGNRRRTTSNSRHRYTASSEHIPGAGKCFSSLRNNVIMLRFVTVLPDVIQLMKTIAHRSFFTSTAAFLESLLSTEERV